jgi:hypothetical protein
MSAAHSFPFKNAIAPVEIVDPGTGNAISVDRSPLVIPLTIAASASETNTLAAPVGPNYELKIYAASVGSGGTRTITAASGLTADTDTTIVFNAAGDWVYLMSFPVGSGTYRWRVISHEGVTGSLQDGVFDDLSAATFTLAGTALSATALEINRVADASSRIVAVTAGATALALTSTLHADRIVVVPIITSAGLVITLPAATGTGDKYTVYNNGVQTLSLTVTALAGDIMYGKSIGFSQTVAASGDIFVPGASDIKYTFNVTTTGGDGGDILTAIDLATDQWLIDVVYHGSGTMDTGFST